MVRAFKLLVRYSITVVVYCEMRTIKINAFEVHCFRRQLVHILAHTNDGIFCALSALKQIIVKLLYGLK